MVEMALDRLKDDNVVDLDEERKAQMVSNLLVVLCGNKEASPIVNAGSIYEFGIVWELKIVKNKFH